ncbi:MAG TPA: hypothetical protein VL553_07085, partial [Sphingomicrobium sp.]|nr:hypothetical protein [Sphingomicrobium sp.]
GQIPMPIGNFPRRMTVVGLSKKRTAIFSPIPLIDADMERIEALGEPAFLIIPSGFHRLDARPYKARFPKARVVAPSGAREAVSEAVPVDLVLDRLGDADTSLITVDGTANREAALVVRRPGGASLIVNDIIAHVARPQGPGAWIMSRLFGFGARRPSIPRPIRSKLVADRQALAAQLDKWAEIPDLQRIVPSHGEIIERQPAAELSRLAYILKN